MFADLVYVVPTSLPTQMHDVSLQHLIDSVPCSRESMSTPTSASSGAEWSVDRKCIPRNKLHCSCLTEPTNSWFHPSSALISHHSRPRNLKIWNVNFYYCCVIGIGQHERPYTNHRAEMHLQNKRHNACLTLIKANSVGSYDAADSQILDLPTTFAPPRGAR